MNRLLLSSKEIRTQSLSTPRTFSQRVSGILHLPEWMRNFFFFSILIASVVAPAHAMAATGYTLSAPACNRTVIIDIEPN